MSVQYFDVHDLAGLMLVLDTESEPLAVISAANAACYMHRYAHLNECAQAWTPAEIRSRSETIAVTEDLIARSLSVASLLHYNMVDDRDFRTPRVYRALAEVLSGALGVSLRVREYGIDRVRAEVFQRVEAQRAEATQRAEMARRPAPLPVDLTIRLTGVHRSGGLGDLHPGDSVSEAIYGAALEVVPPACVERGYLQMGEPADHVDGAPRFLTFQRYQDGRWIYVGQHAHRVRVRMVAP